MSQLQVTGEAKIRDIQGPVVANDGVITALDGAANQYVRGDGTLANFPTSGGGGSSVSYYLNGSVNQGTFGGSTYYQMSKNAITGVGTNFSASANGLIAQFITDANDPDVVSIPSGNWNVEFFMNVSASSGALASFYVEIYKYDGSTFTLLATNVATPEQLTNTTTVDAYFTSVAMPLSSMAITDRLAIRIFVNVASKTVTLYTENNRLCQVITTFSNGLTSLNNLTDQSQYLTTGTSGTNFNIASSGDTHTFNLPVASATNTGKLSSTDWSTFNNKQNALTLTTTGSSGAATLVGSTLNIPDYSVNTTNFVTIGTVQTITGTKTFDNAIRNESGLLLKNGVISGLSGYTSLGGNISNGLVVQLSGSTNQQNLLFQTGGAFSYTFPASTGTLALTSDLSSYVPTSRTLTINGETYDLSANRSWTISTGISGSGADGRVAYWNGTNSITSEAGFIYDASTNRLGVNTSVPNATIGADAALNSGYGLLIKTGASNYNGIGIAIDSTYGNTIETAKLGTAPARNLTLLNQGGFISITENGNLGVNILTANTGIDIYNSTTSQLWLHNAATGIGPTDGVRLALFNNKNANLRNLDGAFSITAEGDFQIITIGAENFRINSANGFVGIGDPATLPSMLTVNGGATISGLTTGQIVFPTSGGTLSGTNSLFWDNTNAKLGIGTNVLSGARVTISSTTEANHLQLVSNAPALTFINAISFTHYATVGMATANNNFITGAVLGDLVLGAYNTNNIWFYNANTNTVRMRIDSDGGGTFSSFVSASGPKSQIRVNGNSVGCGISLTNTIVGANRRNWGIFTEQDVEGDFVIKRSNFSGSEPQSGTTILSLSRDGNAAIGTSLPISFGNTFNNLTTSGSTGSFVLTTNSANTIIGQVGVDDTLVYYGSRTNHPVTFSTNTIERMRINTSGNVGIGTSSPIARLDIVNGFARVFENASGAEVYLRSYYASIGAAIQVANNFPLLFLTANTEQMRITAAGNVGIGTSSPSARLSVTTPTTGTEAENIRLEMNTAAVPASAGLNFRFGSVNGATIYGVGENGSTGASSMRFYTYDGTSSAERMRITSGGELYWAATGTAGSDITNGAFLLRNNNGEKYVQLASGVSADSILIYFYKKNGSGVTFTGSISTVGNSTSFNTTSDYRIKEDLKEIKGLEKVSAIKVYDFKFKGIDNRMDGVIAHELAEVLPYAVSGEKDAVDDEGNIKPQSVDYSKLVPILVKAIQEQQAQIEELSNKIVALESK